MCGPSLTFSLCVLYYLEGEGSAHHRVMVAVGSVSVASPFDYDDDHHHHHEALVELGLCVT